MSSTSCVTDPDDGGSGYGMSGSGMMGGFGPRGGSWQSGGRYGVAGDGQAVTTMQAAAARAQLLADLIGGLHVGEVMQFSDGYYAELLTADGSGATEVLIDPDTGAVSLEHGPAMMWNTSYGMDRSTGPSTTVSADQATATAQAWLDSQGGDLSGLQADTPEAFPGYYTLHTTRNGAVVGMMSVNAETGQVWYHTWHGSFIAMTE
jgi:hypothetical protein